MLLEMIVLARIGKDASALARGVRPRVSRRRRRRTLPRTCAGPRRRASSRPAWCWSQWRCVSLALPERTEVVPARASFVDFPLVIGPWVGAREALEHDLPRRAEARRLPDGGLPRAHRARRSTSTWPGTTRSRPAARCIRRAPACRAAAGRSRASRRSRCRASQSTGSRCASTAR